MRNEIAIVTGASRGIGAAVAQADVADESAVQQLFQHVDGALRVLVNNAGILEKQTRVDRMSAASPKRWRQRFAGWFRANRRT